MINVGAYVLGEFGHLIANDPKSTCVAFIFPSFLAEP
jgi:hypothetical protein